MRKGIIGVICLVILFDQKSSAQNVGIGVASPLAPLHVATIQSEVARLENTTALTTGLTTDLWFRTGDFYTGAIKTIGTGASFARLGFFTFANSDKNAVVERLTILDGGSVGINQTNPTARFEVNGLVKITDGNQASNKFFGCDGTGLGTWKTLPDPVADKFGVMQTIGLSCVSGFFTPIPFNNEIYDAGADFATGTFTVPTTGIYHFDTDVTSSGVLIAPAGSCILELLVNNAAVRRADGKFDANSILPSLNISCDLSLTAGSTVTVRFYQSNGTNAALTIGGSQTDRNPHFSGHRVY